MARFSILIAVAIALSGCVGGQKIKATPQFIKIECKRYSKPEMQKAADELEHMAENVPQLSSMIDDYGSLRAAVCRK